MNKIIASTAVPRDGFDRLQVIVYTVSSSFMPFSNSHELTQPFHSANHLFLPFSSTSTPTPWRSLPFTALFTTNLALFSYPFSPRHPHQKSPHSSTMPRLQPPRPVLPRQTAPNLFMISSTIPQTSQSTPLSPIFRILAPLAPRNQLCQKYPGAALRLSMYTVRS